MPPLGKGRSNYRVDPEGTRRVKGFGGVAYDRVRITWDTSQPDDATGVTLELPQPISHDALMALIEGLNSGRIEDRWA